MKTNSRLGIYIHWPFCTHICPYCDFNIYRVRGHDSDGLFSAIISELKSWHAIAPNLKLTSIYFGGGTPSLMAPKYVSQIIDLCDELWGQEDNIEITLEANPNDGEISKFSDFKSSGVNRLSLGVQSFFDSGLKELGRFHSADDAKRAADLARVIFPQLSIDLIYARQNQSLDEWVKELEIANQTGADHISPYCLTIEPNTAFAKKFARGALKIPQGDLAANFYETTQQKLEELGYIGYEISNHAKSEANFSKHNSLYWQSKDWIGIGPGAHGRISGPDGRCATSNILRPNDYINAINTGGLALVSDEILNADERRDEYYLMGLRLLGGIEINNNFAPLNQEKINELSNLGFVQSNGNVIQLTAQGRVISNYIIAQLLD